MRGRDRQAGKLFSYVKPEALVPADPQLRTIKRLADAALDRLSSDFTAMPDTRSACVFASTLRKALAG